MRMQAKNRNLIVTIALCAGVVGYAFFVFLPTQRSISALQSELETHQSYIAQQQLATATLASLEEELRETREFTHQWREHAPDLRRRSPLNATVAKCAANAGVDIVQLNPQAPETLAHLARVPISLTCEGKFEQIFDFLGELEQLPHVIWVEDMQLAKLDDVSDSIRCELDLVVFADKRENSN